MASIGIEFLIEQHGGQKVRAEVDRLTTATQKAAKAAVPLKSSISAIGSAVTGPLGVATGLALATERLIAFGEANAASVSTRKSFEQFRASIDATKGSLGRATGEALAHSGALDAVATGAERLGEQLEGVASILRLLGPVLDVVMLGVEAMLLPIRGAAAGIEYLSDVAAPLVDGITDLGTEAVDAAASLVGLDEWITTTGESTGKTNKIVKEFTDTLKDMARVAEMGQIKREQATKAAYAEAEAQGRVNAAYAIALRGGMGVVENEEALRKAAADANETLEIRTAELAMIKALGGDAAEAEQLFGAALEQAATIDTALAELDERRWRANEGTADAVERQTVGIAQQVDILGGFLSGATVGSQKENMRLAEQAEFIGEYAKRMKELEDLAKRKQREVATTIKQQDEQNAALKQATMLDNVRTASLKEQTQAWFAVGDAALGMVGKVADVGWAHAVLAIAKAATEIPGMLAVGDFAGAALMGIQAANGAVEQALAQSLGGGGSGGTGGAGAAAAPSSAPPSVADRAEREDVRGDSAYTIEVDGEVLGRVAARSVNKAARRGTAVLDRRATSNRNGRRGLT